MIMAVAYCILGHKNPAQIERLLRAIMRPGNQVVLHYDRRARRSEHAALAALARTRPSLTLLKPQYVNWGRFSQIATQLKMLRTALQTPSWTHAFLISGQDFPLRSQAEIVEELNHKTDESFVSWFDPTQPGHWLNADVRLRRWHLDSTLLEWLLRWPGFGRRLRALLGWSNYFPTLPGITRQLPGFFRWFGGSNHPILSRASVEHLASDEQAIRIERWLRPSGHPDETLVQSVLMNSPLANRVVNDDRRAIFWDAGAPSPRTLTIQDLPRLREARTAGKLFARKFDVSVDADVITALEGDLPS